MANAQILVAEDDKALSMVHRILFEDMGITAKFVENGEEAIAAIERQQPSLLLLDLLMPKKDGFTVLKHIQAKGYAFPVVVLTNLSSEGDKQECMRLGAKDVFVKSEVNTSHLRHVIEKYTSPPAKS